MIQPIIHTGNSAIREVKAETAYKPNLPSLNQIFSNNHQSVSDEIRKHL